MIRPTQPKVIDGFTLLNIYLCKERIRRKFALEQALQEARIRNAQIYQGIFKRRPSTLDIKKNNQNNQNNVATTANTSCCVENKICKTKSKGDSSVQSAACSLTSSLIRNQSDCASCDSSESKKKKIVAKKSSLKRIPSKKTSSLHVQDSTLSCDRPSRKKSRISVTFKAKCSQEELNEALNCQEKCSTERVSNKSSGGSLDRYRSVGTMCDKQNCFGQKKGTTGGMDKATLSSQGSECTRNKCKRRKPSVSNDEIKKKIKNTKNQQQQMKQQCDGRQETKFLCTCNTCGGANTCCCAEDLEAISEEHEPDVQFDVQYAESREETGCPSKSGDDDDPCGEFFDIIRDTMEDAVKKSIEDVFGRYFSCCMEKIDNLAAQMDRSECLLTKVYTDLNDKISYYGERNAQQFQYLCVRMEHDRLFYQQQQEYFLKARSRKAPSCPESFDENGGGCPDQQTSGEDSCHQQQNACSRHCTTKKFVAKCNMNCDDDNVKGGNKWQCTIADDESQGCNDSRENTNSREIGCPRQESDVGSDDDDGKKPSKKGSKSRRKSDNGNSANLKPQGKKSESGLSDSSKKASKKK